MSDKFIALLSSLKKLIPIERLFSDDLRTFAYGTDASFYRLTPKLVVKVVSEDEVVYTIKKCNELNIPITFRASGTSLSGQAISDSVLLVADRSWNQIKISNDGSRITLQPAVLGGRANLELSGYRKKIGPDPASINAATVAGIAVNNASGMTSGVINNSYNTIADMRIVFANGSVLNTADGDDKVKFIEENRELIVELLSITWDVNKNLSLIERIKSKYKIKNTTGYSVNSFIDFQDPIEIIKHLMIGSEGTLGFVSQLTLNTVPSLPNRATSLILFPNVKTACSVIPILQGLPVDAAEIMDRASLRSVENKTGLPNYLKELDVSVAALLIETSANDSEKLISNIDNIKSSLNDITTIHPIEFTSEPKEYLKLWNVRKGLFPSVSKARKAGTTVVIEDVNFDTSKLADAVTDLQQLFDKHSYKDTIIWGHALSGNIHFVFAQDFNDDYEIKRYQRLMTDIVLLVIEKYDGSLKAEHGTGRNMAPFVKYEWGNAIYDFMCRVKNAFDPKGILNPGVLINDDDEIYIKNLKPTPIVNPIIDKCIDCGFCENNCPSKNLTLTPRQRISIWREISTLQIKGENSSKLKRLEQSYNYLGKETCATDGLCELSCPVDIDTGKLIKEIRTESSSAFNRMIARRTANNFGLVTSSLKFALNSLRIIRIILGEKILKGLAIFFRNISLKKIPMWNTYLPRGAKAKFKSEELFGDENTVVYFPSCIGRTMGTYNNSRIKDDQSSVMQRLLTKAGYKIIYPNKLSSLCCGMPYSSKGFKDVGNQKAEELYNALKTASNNGETPILFDTSPCVKTFRSFVKKNNKDLNIHDSVEFINDQLLDKLKITKKDERIAIHSTCSNTKMELTEKLLKIANECATDVYVPEDINCCGFAGDRGFSYPELNQSALENLSTSVKNHNCSSGYSTSKTCEIGLSLHSGIEYNSIVYLVDDCSEPLEKE
jgi:D-lactate dehydrogenase